MVLWRISRHTDLIGLGGLHLSGRWHRLGDPIVYLATSPSAALLEVCVHTSANDVPPKYTLLKVSAPDSVSVSRIGVKLLPEDWRNRQDKTQELGTEWLKSRATALLEVPSAIVPETFNVLLNPLHADASQIQVVSSLAYPFDLRIKL